MKLHPPAACISPRTLARVWRSAQRLARDLAHVSPTAAALCADPSYAERSDTDPSDHAAAAVITAAETLAAAIDDLLESYG